MKLTRHSIILTTVFSVFAVYCNGEQWNGANDKVDLSASLLPMPKQESIPRDQLYRIPDKQPVQRYVIGQGVVDGSVAGETGVEIFHNNVAASGFAWPPGAGVQMADDMVLGCFSSTNLTLLEITVTGGGTGSGPGFAVTFQMFDGCPSDPTDPGQPIPGTIHTANLPNDGIFSVALDRSSNPLAIPSRFWLAATFSTNNAGWLLGEDPQLGNSDGSTFDGPAGCISSFGGCGIACANFAARLLGDMCELNSHVSYRAVDSANIFFSLNNTPNRLLADDVLPIEAPGTCSVTRYSPATTGVFGAYGMQFEIFSNTDDNRPLAPVLGTACTRIGLGNGAPFIADCEVLPSAPVPTARMWITYKLVPPMVGAGPILLDQLGDIGFGADCFTIFGDPEADMWSQCVWFFGGCEDGDGDPCASFYNTVECAGLEPVGACCDILTPGSDNCSNEVFISECGGQFMNNMGCDVAVFDPPCDTGSCCTLDGGCTNLSAAACLQQDGLWRPTLSCDEEGFMCPFPSCFSATESCIEAHDSTPGCNNLDCCQIVCELDSFCCEAGWDSTCVQSALDFCTLPLPSNDNCASATVITDGTHLIDTISASTDGPALPTGPQPNGCDEGNGVALASDVWFNYFAPGNGIVTVDLCSDTDLDSRVAIYNSCTCPLAQGQTVECGDDGCSISQGPTDLQFPVISGNCYKIRVGGAPGPNANGVGTMTVSFSGTGPMCPAGAITFTNPANNAVDARQPNPVNSLTPRQGIQSITVTGPAGAEAACFAMCETATVPGEPNSITNVSANGTTYTLTLARPITTNAVTRIAYTPNGGAPTIGTFTAHPGNVNGDTTAAPTDILAIIDCLNNVNQATNCPWGNFSRDVDQSGVFNPADVLRVIDLLNGADVFDVWNNTPRPSATCTP